MNILYFHSHDTGRYFPHYGFGDSTARQLSGWALENALTFRSAFCAGPTCSPSRAALLTGQYPHSNGMLGLAHRGFSLNDYGDHLVSFLNRKGFHTALCGVQHEGAGCFKSLEGGNRIGYSENISAPFNEENISGETTAQWDLENAGNAARWLLQEGRDSFFLSVGLYSTHRAYPELKTVDTEQLKPLPQIYDNNENRDDHGRFLESQKVYDRAFGTVIKALEEGPYGENTIAVVTVDHGLPLPFSKCNLNEVGMGVALMMKVPGRKPFASYTDAMVSQVDVFPTICDLLNLEKPEEIQGKSFAHLFENPKASHRTHIFGEINFHTSYEPARSVRTERYSYVRSFDRKNLSLRLSNIDNSSAKNLLLHAGIKERKKRSRELYDLYFDPMEKNNLIDDPLYEEVAEEMDKVLREWQQDTTDPLINGELEITEGMIINKTECIEPDSNDFDDYL